MRAALYVAAVAACGCVAPAPAPPPHPAGRKPPHIVALLIDDFGWADASWHVDASTAAGAEVRTPELSALAAGGVTLDRNYAFACCSPTRSAAQTGRNPLHVNTLNLDPLVRNPADNVSGFAGVPRAMTGVAEMLRGGAGYATHFFGKWDAGMAAPEQTPRGRGYDTSLCYFHHEVDYWASTFPGATGSVGHWPACAAVAPSADYRPVDLWRSNVTWEGPADYAPAAACGSGGGDVCKKQGSCPPYPGFPGEQAAGCSYEDDLFRDALLAAIDAHDTRRPFFAFWAPHVVHTPLQVPKATYDRFAAIGDWRRRRYLAMVYHVDAQVGAVAARLRARGMWDDLLMVVSSDNGGPVYQEGGAGASNYPLRGGKFGNFEGGIRVNGFACGGALPAAARGRTLQGLATVWDWYATFAEAAGVADVGDPRAAAAGLPGVDSVSQWRYWTGAAAAPPRTSVALGVPNSAAVGGAIVDKGGAGLWKLLTGSVREDARQGPSFPNASTGNFPNHNCGAGCLFRLDTDPTETEDVAGDAAHAAVLAELRALANATATTVFSPDRGTSDAQGCVTAVQKWGGFWGPFLDLESE